MNEVFALDQLRNVIDCLRERPGWSVAVCVTDGPDGVTCGVEVLAAAGLEIRRPLEFVSWIARTVPTHVWAGYADTEPVTWLAWAIKPEDWNETIQLLDAA
jgi:hypothetical protein